MGVNVQSSMRAIPSRCACVCGGGGGGGGSSLPRRGYVAPVGQFERFMTLMCLEGLGSIQTMLV